MLDIKGFPVFPRLGALTRAEDPTFARPVLAAFSDAAGLTVTYPEGSTENYSSTNVSLVENTGRIAFTASGSDYLIRELRESDGIWLSQYKMSLPMEALEQLTVEGENMNETLEALALDDSVYVLGLVYTNELGRWARFDEDWVLLAPDDETYADMIIIPIDQDKSTDFISMYDANFVTVSDTEAFEAEETTEVE